MVAAIAALERRIVKTVDITGAYLNAKMKEGSEPVDMKLDPIVAKILVKHRPEFATFMREDGSIIVELVGALYGCLESARLWFETFTEAIRLDGYTANAHDPCVWNKGIGKEQVTVVIYVDDLLITSLDTAAIESLEAILTSRFGTLTVHGGDKHGYLGMNFDFSRSGELLVDMTAYEDECIKFMGCTGKASTPASADLFDIAEGDAIVNDKRLKKFHSSVAKLLFASLRTRPDILTPVNFLTSRVKVATEADEKKLIRIGNYLNSTRGMGIRYVFATNDVVSLCASIDASFAVHVGAKSQSSNVIMMGGGPIFVKCGKQKIVTKSSHEAELVALSDGGSQVIWSRAFLIAQGYDMPAAIIYQDNQGTIASIMKGRPASDRSRHVSVRYFWLKERIDSGEVDIQYLPTGEMVADLLTKPLQGDKFRELRDKLLNWVHVIDHS
jgi:hypothetical protein